MITCCLTYVIDPYKIDDFEAYGRRWMALVDRFGGVHHGYFLPAEGANYVAIALFSFPSLARYEEYRAASATDPGCIAARNFARETRCVLSLERTFFRPLDVTREAVQSSSAGIECQSESSDAPSGSGSVAAPAFASRSE